MDNTSATTQTAANRSQTTTPRGQHIAEEDFQPTEDIVQYLKDYARARPDVAALWCFGIGFVVGWKLKPW